MSAENSIDIAQESKNELVHQGKEICHTDQALLKKATEYDSVGQRVLRVELKWDNILVIPKQDQGCGKARNTGEKYEEPKHILNYVSGYVQPKQFLAIIGASGAGKTTLLNYLSNKMFPSDLQASGLTTINGIDREKLDYFKFTAFVQQDDVLLETMTVREILEFTAALKYSSIPKDRDDKVNDLLKELELSQVEDVRFHQVGAERSLTKGEKKKLSIAVELITNPALVFLDEPTTGMDTFTAEKIIKIINKLKMKGRTIIATIHQPNTDIYKRLDQLMLLAYGNVMYFGQASNAVKYFNNLGECCPQDQNPAEFFMMMMTEDKPDKEQKLAKLALDFKESGIFEKERQILTNLTPLEGVDLQTIKYAASWKDQFLLLLVRGWKNNMRIPTTAFVCHSMEIFFAMMSLCMYYDLEKEGFEAMTSRVGAIFFSASHAVMSSMMTSILVFPEERAVFIREQASSLYDVSPYFFSKILNDVPFAVVDNLIYSLLVYWLIGLNTEDGSKFLIFYLGMIATYMASGTYSYLVGSLVSSREVLMNVIPILNMPLMLLSGWYVKLDAGVTILWPLQWLSTFKYSFNLFIKNEFVDNSEIYINAGNTRIDANKMLETFNADLTIFECFLSLIILYIGFGTLALIGLKYASRRV